MSKSSPRIQVPVDEEFLEKLDELRKGRPRAECMRHCFEVVYQAYREKELDRAYREGYVRIPDESRLPAAQADLARELLAGEEW